MEKKPKDLGNVIKQEETKSNETISSKATIKIISEPKEKLNLPSLYEKLSKPVPEEYLENYEDGGASFTGYKAQYAINLLNDVLGLGNWYVDFVLDKLENIKGAWMSYGRVKIYLRNTHEWDDIFLADGIGGSYAKRIENSLKGTKTSAFKNACRYLGIGNELYLLGHDDDIKYEELDNIKQPERNDEEPVNELKEIKNKIDNANSLQDLDLLLDPIQKTEGKAVKELLIKLYNAKKIVLMEKNAN